MIVTRLYGGLGNQLFQYAAGRRLALRHGLPLHLDLSWFATQTQRRFELDVLDIDATVLCEDEWKQLEVPPPVLAEQSFHVDPSVLTAPDHCLLDGYWQSPRYSADIEPVLRADLRPVVEPTAHELVTSQLIAAKPGAVSLHVRRGDFVSDAHTNGFHGTCGLDYYHRAMDLVRGLVPEAHFFLFSDDVDWLADNLAGGDATVVRTPDTALPFEDLRLMSLTRHHVIANSTYSWWGAWLAGGGPDSITVAPRPWFADRSINTDDLLPGRWITLGNA